MKNQGDLTSQKAHNSSITEFKDTKVSTVWTKDFKCLLVKNDE